MKISITKESKSYLTVNEYEVAQRIIGEMREENLNEIAMIAADIATSGKGQKVFEATAEICRNIRVWNQYGDDSGMLDIWASTGDNYAELQRHMSIEHYGKNN